jgi:hypothetical protein
VANPTLIAFSEHDSGAGSAASEASASLTWQTGDVLVAVAMNEGANNGLTFTISNTGSGLSWTVAQSHISSSDTSLYAWTTTASAGSSGTVTATISTANEMSMGVYQFRAPGGSTIGVGNSNIVSGKTTTQHVVGLLMTSADSSVVWAAADWSASALETVTPAATTHSNVSPGPSASPASGVQATHYTWYIEELDDQASTGTINYGTTATANGPVAIVAVEVTVSGGAAAFVSPRRMPLSL